MNTQDADASALGAAIAAARAEATERGLAAPSPVVGGLLSTLAASGAAAGTGTGAVAITPSAGVVGLHMLAGLPDKATVTCIDPDADRHARAKTSFRDAGYSPSRARFLPATPLDVLGRLAADSYHLIYADVEPVDMQATIDAVWPLLTRGGTLVLAQSLLDGTVADASRIDRDTIAARSANDYADSFEGAVVTRLPLDSGLTLITRR
ncbi:class I SAM-dependent methyltransferase [Corynebacterium aquatimens]